MRILLVTSVYPTPYSPTKGTFNAALVTGLHLAGDDVRVIAPVPWIDRLRRRPTDESSEETAHPVWFYPPKLGRASHHHWMRRAVLPAADVMTDEWKPDLVLGYWTHPDGTVALEVARRLGVPGVLVVGGSDIQLLTDNPRRRKVIVETLLAADMVLTVGAPLRQQVIGLGIPPERIGSFVRGVDRERFAPGDGAAARARLGLPLDRPIALWVGRMVPVKGLDLLVAAWQKLQPEGNAPIPLLVLAGDGEERGMLELAASAMPDRIRFVGSVPNSALPDWYRAADLVVLPSRSEGVPNVLVEGLACGTPFVASQVGGIPELLEPNSRVVPAMDIPALTAALQDALAHPPFARRADSSHIQDRADAIGALRTQLAQVRAGHDAGARI